MIPIPIRIPSSYKTDTDKSLDFQLMLIPILIYFIYTNTYFSKWGHFEAVSTFKPGVAALIHIWRILGGHWTASMKDKDNSDMFIFIRTAHARY